MFRKVYRVVAGIGVAAVAMGSTAALADYTYVTCDASTCSMISCRDFGGQTICGVVDTWPRPNEVSGE